MAEGDLPRAHFLDLGIAFESVLGRGGTYVARVSRVPRRARAAVYSRGIQLRNFNRVPPTPVITRYPSANCLARGPKLSLSARGTTTSRSFAYPPISKPLTHNGARMKLTLAPL